MALTAQQKVKLRAYLFERFDGDVMRIIVELWLAFFETAAQRTTRAQAWIAVVKARRTTDKANADTANTANKATLDTEIAELDALNSGV